MGGTVIMQSINRFDSTVISTVKRLPGAIRPLMVAASAIGEPVVMGAALGAAGLYAINKHHSRDAWLAAWGIVGILLSNLLKLALHRTRPDTYMPILRHSYSFPSGHAMASMITGILVSYWAVKYLPGIWGWIITGALTLFVLTVGISRLYLGAHYPSDVLGGWVLGALWAVIIIKLVRA